MTVFHLPKKLNRLVNRTRRNAAGIFRSSKPQAASKTGGFIGNTHGGAVILTTLALPVIMGGLAMAIDIGYWYTAKRQTQQQADTAALGAARALSAGVSSTDQLRAVALNDAIRNGFVNVSPNRFTFNSPPTSGPMAGNTAAIEIIVERKVDSFFARYFDRSSVSMSARAVASVNVTDACVLALSNNAARAINLPGTMTINAPNCGFASNATTTDSIQVGGTANLIAKSLVASGEINVSGSLTVEEAMLTHQTATLDPYQNLALPAVGACNANNFRMNSGSNVTINPGVYCGGIQMNGSGTLYLNKGTYILNRGDFIMTGSGRIRCGNCAAETDGVTIILTATSGQVGSVRIGGSGDIELSAPGEESNPYKGVLFYQDRAAAAGNDSNLNGGASMKLSGALYLPKSDIKYAGSNSFAGGKNCVVMVGLTVEFAGSSGFSQTDCTHMGTKLIDVGRAAVTLKE